MEPISVALWTQGKTFEVWLRFDVLLERCSVEIRDRDATPPS
jgi:hypothetical protein